jgi:hypothetical protein
MVIEANAIINGLLGLVVALLGWGLRREAARIERLELAAQDLKLELAKKATEDQIRHIVGEGMDRVIDRIDGIDGHVRELQQRVARVEVHADARRA